MSQNQKNLTIIITSVVLLIGTVGIVVTNISENDSTSNTAISSSSVAIESSSSQDSLSDDVNSSTESTTQATAKYKDGTYVANGEYFSEPGKEAIGVTLTISDDKITSVSIEDKTTHPNSKIYVAQFSSGIEAAVVGKDLDEGDTGKINGSSDTPDGFNKALESIRQQASN